MGGGGTLVVEERRPWCVFPSGVTRGGRCDGQVATLVLIVGGAS